MNPLEQRVQSLERQLAELKANRFANMTTHEVSSLTNSFIQRTSASLASGATIKTYLILSHNGQRYAVPGYDKFEPLV